MNYSHGRVVPGQGAGLDDGDAVNPSLGGLTAASLVVEARPCPQPM